MNLKLPPRVCQLALVGGVLPADEIEARHSKTHELHTGAFFALLQAADETAGASSTAADAQSGVEGEGNGTSLGRPPGGQSTRMLSRSQNTDMLPASMLCIGRSVHGPRYAQAKQYKHINVYDAQVQTVRSVEAKQYARIPFQMWV